MRNFTVNDLSDFVRMINDNLNQEIVTLIVKIMFLH